MTDDPVQDTLDVVNQALERVNPPVLVSPCCRASIRVASSGHRESTTCWFECTACGQPCDPKPA